MKKKWQKLWVVGIILGALMGHLNVAKAEEKVPELYFNAVNPGYTVDGVSNVGELIEIRRGATSDEMISLAGLTVGYTNSSGNEAILVEFPENSYLVGESILLRLASSPGHELAAMNYTKTLAFKAGPLVLKRGEDIIDSVCWLGSGGCVAPFKSTEPTTLVRNLASGEFEHVLEYEVQYDEESFKIEETGMGGGEQEIVESQCKGVMFTEVLGYYDESQSEQFIELYNANAEQVLLNGCLIRYKGKTYPLNGIIKPEGYLARYLTDFRLTKNPTNVNLLELVDSRGEVVHKMEYTNGQRKATSFALIGYDDKGKEIWRTTYLPTPGAPNAYQEYKTCEEGKVINETTGNCVKITTIEEKTCPAGQYLNPLTGRCKKIEVAKATTCKEGYILNEETGRCIKEKKNDGAGYGLTEENYKEETSFVAIYLIIAVVVLGVIVAVFEFRKELARLFGKVFRRFRQKHRRGTDRH